MKHVICNFTLPDNDGGYSFNVTLDFVKRGSAPDLDEERETIHQVVSHAGNWEDAIQDLENWGNIKMEYSPVNVFWQIEVNTVKPL